MVLRAARLVTTHLALAILGVMAKPTKVAVVANADLEARACNTAGLLQEINVLVSFCALPNALVIIAATTTVARRLLATRLLLLLLAIPLVFTTGLSFLATLQRTTRRSSR